MTYRSDENGNLIKTDYDPDTNTKTTTVLQGSSSGYTSVADAQDAFYSIAGQAGRDGHVEMGGAITYDPKSGTYNLTITAGDSDGNITYHTPDKGETVSLAHTHTAPDNDRFSDEAHPGRDKSGRPGSDIQQFEQLIADPHWSNLESMTVLTASGRVGTATADWVGDVNITYSDPGQY